MEIISKIHSYWAYVAVILAILITIIALYYFISKKPIDNAIKKLSLFTSISFHVQLLIGVATYFTSPLLKAFSSLSMQEMMDNDTARLLKLEHPMMMIAGIIFITIANAKIKRADSLSASILVMILLAVFCVLSRIPYNLWF